MLPLSQIARDNLNVTQTGTAALRHTGVYPNVTLALRLQ